MSEQEKKQILELLGMVIDSIHVITERTQRTTEAEIEDVTKRYGTKHSAAKPTRNNERFTQICTRFGKKSRFEKLAEMLNQHTNDQPEQCNK